MGKFFVAGVFLGAAATYAVIHFTQVKGFSEKELKTEVGQAAARAAADAKREAEKKARDALDKKVAELTAANEAAIAEKTAANTALAAEKKAAAEKLAGASGQIKALSDRNTELTKRLEAAMSSGRISDAPRGLLARRVGLLGSGAKLWRTLGEVNASLEQAGTGWSDVEAIRSRGKALPALAADYAKKAREVKKFLEENSAALGRDLGKLDPYRVGVQEKDIKALGALIEKIQAAIAGMKSASTTISARKDAWTDSGVYVKKGDIVQVRAKGAWKMIEHWPPAGPEGWEAGGQHKIAQNARAGSLILRISISQKMSPAYLGQPIPADREGRVVLRMNDKTVAENGGEVTAKILCISPGALEKATAEWRKLVGK
ncbi:MAG: hypothetical protein ACYS9X_07150 [Planctomycetota bacterium]|jgi:hypothetical protein